VILRSLLAELTTAYRAKPEPALLSAIRAVASDTAELEASGRLQLPAPNFDTEAQAFMARCPDYEPDDHNCDMVLGFLRERKLPQTRGTLTYAWRMLQQGNDTAGIPKAVS
jgi:hypothetical protein